MEGNKIVLTEDGVEKEYRVEGKNYIVYTNDEKNDDGDIISYAAEYVTNEETGNAKIISIKDDKTWEFIRDVLNSIQNEEEVK